jgi:hypothetical protein
MAVVRASAAPEAALPPCARQTAGVAAARCCSDATQMAPASSPKIIAHPRRSAAPPVAERHATRINATSDATPTRRRAIRATRPNAMAVTTRPARIACAAGRNACWVRPSAARPSASLVTAWTASTTTIVQARWYATRGATFACPRGRNVLPRLVGLGAATPPTPRAMTPAAMHSVTATTKIRIQTIASPSFAVPAINV